MACTFEIEFKILTESRHIHIGWIAFLRVWLSKFLILNFYLILTYKTENLRTSRCKRQNWKGQRIQDLSGDRNILSLQFCVLYLNKVVDLLLLDSKIGCTSKHLSEATLRTLPFRILFPINYFRFAPNRKVLKKNTYV